MMSTLEERLVAGLTTDVTSSAIAAMIDEAEAAIAEAEAAAARTRELALDPIASPDAASARETFQAAEFARDRLKTLLPRLKARRSDVQTAEHQARWDAEYRQVEAEQNVLAEELAATYPRFVAQLLDLLQRARAIDSRASHINGSALPGEARRLLPVELRSRGLDCFSSAQPSILGKLQLPDFDLSSRMAWPQPHSSELFMAASKLGHDRRLYSGDWWQVYEEDTLLKLEQQAKELAVHTAEVERQWRGPRWWDRERL